jgi:Ca-activated chloride channel homolog
MTLGIAFLIADLILLFSLLGFPSTGHAQDDPIRVDTNLITVPVAVKDRDGRYISNLRKEDFRIFENGIEQELSYFQPTDQLFTVFLLLDVSDSMTYETRNMFNAANAFFERLRADDRLIVATFDNRVDTYINNKPVEDVRRGKGKIRFLIVPSRGDTMVYDAVDHAIDKMKRIRGRKAIILFSDGKGSGYSHTAEDNLREAEEQEAMIYALQYDTLLPPGMTVNEKESARHRKKKETAEWYMRELAEQTGGRYFEMKSISNLADAFKTIALELGQQYSLGYYAKVTGKNGERRQIKVKVNVPDAAVRSRASYVVGATKDR